MTLGVKAIVSPVPTDLEHVDRRLFENEFSLLLQARPVEPDDLRKVGFRAVQVIPLAVTGIV